MQWFIVQGFGVWIYEKGLRFRGWGFRVTCT